MVIEAMGPGASVVSVGTMTGWLSSRQALSSESPSVEVDRIRAMVSFFTLG